MATKLKTRPTAVAEPAPRSDERQKLADAISARAAAVQHAAAVAAAVDNARRAAGRDRTAIVAAKQEITFAEERAADRLVAAARGLPEPEGMTPDEAKAAVTALEGKVAAHQTAISHLQEKLAEAHRRTAAATDKVTEAVYATLRSSPEVRRLYRDFVVATKTHSTLYAIVSSLPAADMRPPGVEIDATPDYAAVRLWNSVVDRLMADPDAALPD